MEKVYVIGATGNIGQQVVKGLLSKGVDVTVFARDEDKVNNLFGESKHLSFVKGDYDNLEGYKKTIQGHSRLFIVVSDLQKMGIIASTFAKLAYEAGVVQIVHVSSFTVSMPWRQHVIGAVHQEAEESILAIPGRGSYVALRPAAFFTNQIWGDKYSIQSKSTIFGSAENDTKRTWISTGDIADLALVVLQDPVEKHNDAVYEMASERISEDERAALISKVLGKTITYTRVDPKQRYDEFISLGFSHVISYELAVSVLAGEATPGLSILLGRKPESLEDWLQQNKQHFV